MLRKRNRDLRWEWMLMNYCDACGFVGVVCTAHNSRGYYVRLCELCADDFARAFDERRKTGVPG
jgi:hypothetical protein